MLHEAGLVVDDRQGQWVEYSLAEKREGSAKAQILAMALDMLEGDAQVAADLRRLATASREQCDAAHP
jgi:DNA-binding transcriptional ArsR family regulator